MNRSLLLRAFGALTFCAALGAGQGAPAPKSASSSPVANLGYESRLIIVHHASPYQLRDILRPMLSAGPGSSATIDAVDRDGLRALAVRDFPENLAAIEAAVKRLDIEAPVRKQVEFHIHVLFGSKSPSADGEVPEELKDVLASLKSTLAYRSYAPVASFVQRAADGAEVVEGQGQAEMATRGSKGDARETPIILKWGIYLCFAKNSIRGLPRPGRRDEPCDLGRSSVWLPGGSPRIPGSDLWTGTTRACVSKAPPGRLECGFAASHEKAQAAESQVYR